MYRELKWYFDPSKYFVDLHDEIDQCIAPTQKGHRCTMETQGGLQLVSDLRKKAESLSSGIERESVVQDYVLHRCCSKYHQKKLKMDSSCLKELVIRYESVIPRGQEQQVADFNPTFIFNPEDPSPVDLLEPYEDPDHDSLRNILLRDLEHDSPARGSVYVYVRPSKPDYVKIGYTSKRVISRIREWQTCNPDAELKKATFFEYPKRMESLIHIQMAKWRHAIARCANCDTSHIEWFKIAMQYASAIIDDWERIVAKEPLYTIEGKLTATWLQRMKSIKGPLTTKRILGVLKAEEKRDQSNSGTEVVARMTLSAPKQSTAKELSRISNSDVQKTLWPDDILEAFRLFMQALTQPVLVEITTTSLDATQPAIKAVAAVA